MGKTGKNSDEKRVELAEIETAINAHVMVDNVAHPDLLTNQPELSFQVLSIDSKLMDISEELNIALDQLKEVKKEVEKEGENSLFLLELQAIEDILQKSLSAAICPTSEIAADFAANREGVDPEQISLITTLYDKIKNVINMTDGHSEQHTTISKLLEKRILKLFKYNGIYIWNTSEELTERLNTTPN